MSSSTNGRPPAMSDVAHVAGVSHQTVSRVLNEPERVRPETRERVQAAINSLGYRRNTAARVLVTRKSATIGVLVPDTFHYGPTSTLLGIESAAREAGYWLSLATLATLDSAQISAALDHFIDQGVEAIAVIAPTAAVLDMVSKAAGTLPIVTVTAGTPIGAPMQTVCVDQLAGARAATEHLVSLGHTRIAHIAGPRDWFEAQERAAGWRSVMREHSLPSTEVYPGTWSAESGYDAGLAIAAASPRATAIFAANDQMALGAIRALTERGITVPRDVSVVGFDDVPDAGNYRPPLTTVHQDFTQLGRRCIALLLDEIAGLEVSQDARDATRRIKATLVVRGSTARASETRHV